MFVHTWMKPDKSQTRTDPEGLVRRDVLLVSLSTLTGSRSAGKITFVTFIRRPTAGCLVLSHTSVKGLWYLLWEGSPPRMGFNHSPLMKCSRWIGATPRSRSPFIRPLSRVWSVIVHQKWNLSASFSPNLTSVLQRLVNTSVFTPLTFSAYQTIM